MFTRHSQDVRRLFALCATLLVLMAIVPLALAEHGRAPLQQAATTPTAAATTTTGVSVETPSTLPETGGEVFDTTPVTLAVIVAIGVIVVLFVANFVAENRTDDL